MDEVNGATKDERLALNRRSSGLNSKKRNWALSFSCAGDRANEQRGPRGSDPRD